VGGSGLQERGEQAFRSFVRRSDDRRLERTVGSALGLRIVFTAMARRYEPGQGGGFAGDLQYHLRGAAGPTRSWTVTVDGDRARARRGVAAQPALTVKLSLADFARLAAGELDPGKALLTGRLDLEGELVLALRLGAMFGRPGG